MEESVTYQAIINKGFRQGLLQGERKVLLRHGTKSFGAPSAEVVAALNAITDPADLEELVDRLLEVGSWRELLEMPDTRSPS